MIEAAGEGVVVYLRQEGRGIGLVNKLKAYGLQDGGLDTVEANERLGFPADLRNYGVGAQILSDLGVHRLRLITNNPRKIAGLGGYGLQVEDRIPLVMDAGTHNAEYLRVKRTKLGHLMEESAHGVTAVLAWQGEGTETATAQHFEALRRWASAAGLLLEREEHPRLLALLGQPRLTLLLGAREDRQLSAADLAGALMAMARWDHTRAVSLLLAPDAQRRSHPSGDQVAEVRPFSDLDSTPAGGAKDAGGSATCPLLQLAPGAFIVWQ
jgi:3,4-dihydroxy 2-butanone 4-phosphate synthase/GTP cyclohydrolase II